MPTISPAQIRAARAFLGWTMLDLSHAAQVSVSTVKRAEDPGSAIISASMTSLLVTTFENAGITFLPDTGSGAGVRLMLRRPLAFPGRLQNPKS